MAAAITQPVSTLRWNNGKHWHNSPLRKAGYRCLTSLTGFARGLEEDAEGLRAFAAMHKELIVASSYSKTLACTTSVLALVLWLLPTVKPLIAHSAK